MYDISSHNTTSFEKSRDCKSAFCSSAGLDIFLLGFEGIGPQALDRVGYMEPEGQKSLYGIWERSLPNVGAFFIYVKYHFVHNLQLCNWNVWYILFFCKISCYRGADCRNMAAGLYSYASPGTKLSNGICRKYQKERSSSVLMKKTITAINLVFFFKC